MEQESNDDIEITVKLKRKDLVKSDEVTSDSRFGFPALLGAVIILLFALTRCNSGATNNVEINGDGARVEVGN